MSVTTNDLKMWTLAGGICLVLTAVLLLLQWQVHGERSFADADFQLRCVHDDQCERPNDHGFMAETQNTLSNLAYLYFGICVIVRAGAQGIARQRRPGMLMFGLSLCFLALCSAYYHGTLNFADTQTADGQLRGVLGQKGEAVCRAEDVPHDAPQVLDMVGVYAALISLFLYIAEIAFHQRDAGASAGARTLALVLGIGLPVVGMVMLAVVGGGKGFGGPLAGLVLLHLLAVLSLFAFAMYEAGAGRPPAEWFVWTVWAIIGALMAAVAYLFKSDFGWDSTAVFVAMMFFLLGALAASWLLSGQAIPWPEAVLLGAVFLLGIAPRLLDGMETEGAQVLRKVLCHPDGLLQAHAFWHVMSACALALSYDMAEKSRRVYVGAPGTVLLPQDGGLSDDLRQPLGRQAVSSILLKIVLSTASLLALLWVLLSSGQLKWLGIVLTGTALLMSLQLWLWPLFGSRSGN